MSNVILLALFLILTYLIVHGVFYFIEALRDRSFHRQKLREVLGMNLKRDAWSYYRREPSF